jgi:hypothetical protein
MIIKVQRLFNNDIYTGGAIYIDGVMKGYTLEDPFRLDKIKGITRIPAGVFQMALRTEGTMNIRYKEKFKFHKGMLYIKNIPNFEYVYIHIGNTAKDTSGCILVGLVAEFCCNSIQKSELCYKSIYPMIAKAILNKENVSIHVVDELIG